MMTPLRGPSTHRPLSFTSQSTPTEEDLAKASAWDDEDTSTLVSSKWKGKGKQHDDDDDDDRTVGSDTFQRDAGEYPPMAEEDIEARKVEQTLKRWETLEKQRRKMARESRASKLEPFSPTSSFSMSGMGRRASQLWHVRGSRGRPRGGADHTHPHMVLEDADETVHKEQPAPPSASSPVSTPRMSIAEPLQTPPISASSQPENPFDNPQYVEISEDSGSMMAATPTQSSFPPLTSKAVPNSRSGRPVLRFALSPPLDSSRTPPMSRTRPPEDIGDGEGGRDKRWWTDWLCGCREDGEDQTGRTNPMG